MSQSIDIIFFICYNAFVIFIEDVPCLTIFEIKNKEGHSYDRKNRTPCPRDQIVV